GPAHGGANEAVLKMLLSIGRKENIPAFLEKVKNKENSTRLMGFGHRVYRNFDPRAHLIRQMAHSVLEKLGVQNDPTFEL
ncbi:citrate/2-methylcitrate synthase, partial [Staphylococcus aureus]